LKTKRWPERATLVAQLDSLFGLYVKLRDKRVIGKCPFHVDGVFKPIEQVFHFITRGKHSIRWDERNAVGSCAGCNIRYEHDQGFVDYVLNWYKTTRGLMAWEQLVRDGNKLANFSRSDLVELRDELRLKLEGRHEHHAVPG